MHSWKFSYSEEIGRLFREEKIIRHDWTRIKLISS